MHCKSPFSFLPLTFKVIPPYPYHSESQSLAFISTDITHLTFRVLYSPSLSSPHHPVLIAYSSLLVQIPPFTAHVMVLRGHATYIGHVVGHPTLGTFMSFHWGSLLRTRSLLYSRVVLPLLIFDTVFQVTFGDILEEA